MRVIVGSQVSVVKVFAISFGIAILLVGTAPDAMARKTPNSSEKDKTTTQAGTGSGALIDPDPDTETDKDLAQVSAIMAKSDQKVAAGELDNAVMLLIGALKDFGENPHLRERLSRIYYLKGNVDDAISELEVAISLDPTVFDYHAGVAWLYSIAGNYPESVKYAKQAIALDSTKAYPLVVMGFSLGCLGKRQQATEFLKKAIALDAQNATAYLYLADVLLAEGNYKEALPLYQKSLKLDPKTASAFVGLGDCFQKMGHQKEALSAYKRAVDLAPQDPTARGHLGFAMSQSGDYMGAMRQGFTANSIRIGLYWGKFMGMFVAVWAGIFILFGTIFGAMFMGSRFNPVAGETVLNEFVMVFYRDRPGRFVVTDRRLVFVPEVVSRWFGATRVSIQREQIMSCRTEAAHDATVFVVTSTSETSHSFRVPAPVVEPLKNVLSEQGLFGEGLQSLEATGAMRAVSADTATASASTAATEEISQEVSQELSNSFIAASFDFRTPEAAEETDSASTMKLEAVNPDAIPAEVETLGRPKSFSPRGLPVSSASGSSKPGETKTKSAEPAKKQIAGEAKTESKPGEAVQKAKAKPKNREEKKTDPKHNRRAEDKPAHNRRAEDKQNDEEKK
jgi:tetratricopeptide (TPR) repeat protein